MLRPKPIVIARHPWHSRRPRRKKPRRRMPTGLLIIGHHASVGAGLWLVSQGCHVGGVPGGVALRAGSSPTGLATTPLGLGCGRERLAMSPARLSNRATGDAVVRRCREGGAIDPPASRLREMRRGRAQRRSDRLCARGGSKWDGVNARGCHARATGTARGRACPRQARGGRRGRAGCPDARRRSCRPRSRAPLRPSPRRRSSARG